MNPFLKSTGYLALLSVFFLGGFVARDLRQGKSPALSGIVQKPSTLTKTPTQIFSEEYSRIAGEYNQDLDEESLLYAALSGTMSSLGDPHTSFLEPVVAQEFEDSSMGRQFFGGVGARLMPDPMGVKVIQVFKGAPADKGGIKNGDIIVGVDGEDVGGKESDEIVTKIKGEVGTKVNVTVFRGNQGRLNFSLTRAKIVPPSADGNLIDGTKIGYVLVTGFEAPTAGQFARALSDLDSQGAKGLVIDLRNNPGGLLDSAKDMLSLFLDYKTFVVIEGRGGEKQTLTTDGGRARDLKMPIVILVNNQSASAAEIFSGAMKDYGLATLVGEHTYGKASVQNVLRLDGGGSAKITIAHYRLPSGADISRKVDDDGRYVSGGIKPDVNVELAWGPRVAMGELSTDNQLQKAVEIINKKNAPN